MVKRHMRRVRIVETDLTAHGPIVVRPGETLWQAAQRVKAEASA